MDKLKSLLRGAANSATLGFGDEIVGGVNALKDIATTDKEMGDLGDLYTQYRDRYREGTKAAQQANPGAYTAGELAGGLATIAMPGSAIKAPSLAKAALQGAGYGAAMGLGNAEGDLQDQAIGTAKGAALGAAMGPVAKGAGEAFQALRGAMKPRAAEKLMPISGSAKGAIGAEVEELAGALRNQRIAGPKSPDELMASYKRAQNDKILRPMDQAAERMASDAKARAAMLDQGKDEATQAIDNTTQLLDTGDADNLDELTKALWAKFGGK